MAPLIERAVREIQSFERWSPPDPCAGLIISAICAVRPDAVTSELGKELCRVLTSADLDQTWQPEVDEAFGLLPLLIPTPAGSEIYRAALEMLRRPTLHRRWFLRSVDLLVKLFDLRPEAFDLHSLVELLQYRDPEERDLLLLFVISPIVLARPESITLEAIQQLTKSWSEPQHARYLLASIAGHQSAQQLVRDLARDVSNDWFALRGRWQEILATEKPSIICVQNICDGQGDEIVRVVPLLQALLDEFPQAEATVVTDRGYLYRHSRITTVSFDESDRVRDLVRRGADILIDYSERSQSHLNYDQELIKFMDSVRQFSPPKVDVRADKGANHFTFGRFDVNGIDWAAALGVDEPVGPSVYDPVFRLIAELGLPLRVGTQHPRSQPVLDGLHTDEIEAAWTEIANLNLENRPNALLNPFGGSAELKGLTQRKYPDLARLVESLINDGYFVIICPNGQPWGSAASISHVLTILPEELRRYVTVSEEAPGSARMTGEIFSNGFPRTPGEFIQQLISFVGHSDLVVTVEGWMMHVAYLTGKPYRLLTTGASELERWQPWGAGSEQRRWVFAGDATLDRIPLPEEPRKRAWLELIRRITALDWIAYLKNASTTEDVDIRVAIVKTIGRIGDTFTSSWLATRLDDSSIGVRAAAAEALLHRHRESLGFEGLPDAELLETYRLIGSNPPRWQEVIALGTRSLEALHEVLGVEEPVIRREAALCIERIQRERAGLVGTPLDIEQWQGISDRETRVTQK